MEIRSGVPRILQEHVARIEVLEYTRTCVGDDHGGTERLPHGNHRTPEKWHQFGNRCGREGFGT